MRTLKVGTCSGVGGKAVDDQKYLCTHHGYSVDKLRLIHNGKICINTDTMASLDVETGDSFDVYLEREWAWVGHS